MRRIYDDIPQPFNRALGPRIYRDEYKREEIKKEQMKKDCFDEPGWRKEQAPLDRRPPHVPSREEPCRPAYPDRMPFHDPSCDEWNENWQKNRPFSHREPPCAPVCQTPPAEEEPLEAAACAATAQRAFGGSNPWIFIMALLLLMRGGGVKDNENCF